MLVTTGWWASMNKNIKQISLVGIFTALALIMYFIEGMFPPVLPVLPYAKIGLSNIIAFLALIIIGFKGGLTVVILKCLLGSIFSGNIFALVFSLSGGITSYLAMYLLYKYALKHISISGISVVGALTHNFVQVLVASLLIENIFTFVILPYMLAFSLFAGIITGLTVHYIIKQTPTSIYTE